MGCKTGSGVGDSERRGSRLYRDIRSGFEAAGAADEDEGACGVGNSR
jgi:hypothetical protein